MAAGQSLIVPNKIANVRNNTDTFRPYDPHEAIGNNTPNRAPPPKKDKGCGMLARSSCWRR
ncbi:MAG TPA: hypothetical protein VF727_16970 [Allosphingosinicella sp.]